MLEIPKIEDRIPLIKAVHLLGHFKTQTTYNRLREKYYWRNMVNDITHYVKHCVTCLKHDFSSVKNHSALAIPITGIFDRIGVDLVFGLPETDEGYKGILIITEFLTKFPYAVAIKTKSAEEIASQLWNYFSIFGPTKIMLSDQGKEFMNSVVDKLLSNIGTEHTVTSPYHPQCNGMAEKLNSTLISTIRKHTDSDPLNWHKWLPYCLLAYRSRVHSSTKFTPFELMFGRPMNLFIDSRNQGSTDNIELLNRIGEIQLLFEKDIPEAMTNIDNAQQIQIRNQNNRQTLQSIVLTKGTEVYVKNLLLQNKLLPEYNGPYFITGTTKLGNYWLQDATGLKMKDSLPLSRLKVVDTQTKQTEPIETTDEPTFYIEKIIKDRKRKHVREFFVKWINFSALENSWVTETDIVDPQLIKNYDLDKKQTLKSQSESRSLKLSKLRPKEPKIKKINSINYIGINTSQSSHIYLILCIILLAIGFVKPFLLADSFQYCQGLSNSRILDINGICQMKPTISKTIINPQKNAKLTIMSLMHHKIHGMGVECKMERINIKLTTNWINYPYRNELTEIIHLTKEDCQYMVATERCDGRKMICDNTICTINYMPDETNQHRYREEIKLHGIRCSFQPKLIIAEALTDSLFGHGQNACKVTDFGCILQDTTIVWDRKIIHLCPYEIVKKGIFTISTDNTVFNDELHMLLKVTGFIRECSMKLYTTTEGLFIIGDNNTNLETLQLDPNKEIQTINEMILTDQDYAVHQLLELHKQWIVRSCIQLKNILRLLTYHTHEYFIITDADDKDAIIYSNGKNLYLPICEQINVVDVLSPTKFCYTALPVTFFWHNITKQAFLNHKLILTDSSSLINCNTSIDAVVLPKTRRILYRTQNKVRLEKQTIENFQTINFIQPNLTRINFGHNQIIKDGIDIVSQFQKLLTVVDTGINLTIIENDDSVKHGSGISLEALITWIPWIERLPFIIGSVLSFIAIIILTICICKCKKYQFCINICSKCWENIKITFRCKKGIQNNDLPENNTELIDNLELRPLTQVVTNPVVVESTWRRHSTDL